MEDIEQHIKNLKDYIRIDKDKDTYDNIYNINKILGRENTDILSKKEFIEKYKYNSLIENLGG